MNDSNHVMYFGPGPGGPGGRGPGGPGGGFGGPRRGGWGPPPPPPRWGFRRRGCYVATCVYGSYDCPQVWVLRRFRDEYLARHLLGRAFIHTYYAVSPAIVKACGNQKWFQSFWKARLDSLVQRLEEKGYQDSQYDDPAW